MGIVKIVNCRPKSLNGLMRSIRYVLRNDNEKLLSVITGPYNYDKISSNKVFRTFWDEKKIWGKTEGRQCTHSIISWHKDEIITVPEALRFGREFAEKIMMDSRRWL